MKYVDINNVRSEEMRRKWQKIIDDDVDPFDPQYVKRYVEGSIIYETEFWYAFQNDHQYSDTEIQIVIVTKSFFNDTYDMPDNVWLDLKKIKKELRDTFNITGGGLIIRFGDTEKSGGSVVHQHAQIIVPKKGKKVAAWFGSEKNE